MTDASEPEPNPKPEIERAQGTFAELLRTASENADALAGLAAAYASFDAATRRRLVECAVSDAEQAGVSPTAALLAWLATERETPVAGEIARVLAGYRKEASIRVEPCARCEGDAEEGSALFVQPLHGVFVELLAIAWNREGVTTVWHEPLAELRAVDAMAERMPRAELLSDTPMDRALDLVVELLWSHRDAAASWPPELARFATMLRRG